MSIDPARVAIFVSAGSRSGEETAQRLREKVGDRVMTVKEMARDDSWEAEIGKVANAGAEVIAIAGGDGTIKLGAPACAERKLTMGIIPSGTANMLARELNLPLDPVHACEFIWDGASPRCIDIGVFNEKSFVTVATVGITSVIAEYLTTAPKGIFGRLTYIPAVIRATHLARTHYATIEADGEKFEGRLVQFVAAVTRLHGGPFAATPDAAIDDGLLSIYAVRSNDRHALAKYGISILFGRHTDLPNVWSKECRKAVIQLRRPADFVLDGDLVRTDRATISVRPGGLTVLAGPPKTED